jgi:serine/threonine protein kinase
MSPAAAASDAQALSRELDRAVRAELLAGKYRLLAGIGRGGMADVFLGSARGPAGVNKLVVIKRLREGRSEDPTLVSMFLDEARLAARFNHPNIVHTYEVHEVGVEYIIVMEYLEGQSLRRLIRALCAREQQCPPALAAHLLVEVLNGLHYVHEMADYDSTPLGIVHRDVSPQNLFVTYDGQIKVLDFGIAKGALNATETQDGVLKGKFSYMAPEQASSEPVDRRADIFSAGVVLWELLTGRRLYHCDAPDTLLQLVAAPLVPPSSLVPSLPPELDEILGKALQVNPGARYASALEMSCALSDFLDRSRQLVRPQDIGRMMLELFGEEREEMTRRVQSYMSTYATLEAMPSPEREVTAATSLLASKSARKPELAPSVVLGPKRSWASGLVAVASVAAAFWLRNHPPPAAHPSLAARVSAESSESFHLTLSSEPAEAQVEWGGKVVGQTPMLIDLLPGPQTFVLSRNGHYNATVLVNVSAHMAGKAESRTVVMVPRVPDVVHEPSAAVAVLSERPVQKRNNAAPETIDIAQLVAAASDPPAAPPAEPALELEPEAEKAAADLAPPVAAPLPPAIPRVPTVLPFGPDMTRPVLVSGAELVVPREARVAHVTGTMIARCTITVEGLLHGCRIIKGLPFLDQPMLDSLATRRYSPVRAEGKPVSVQYVFNLRVDSLS